MVTSHIMRRKSESRLRTWRINNALINFVLRFLYLCWQHSKHIIEHCLAMERHNEGCSAEKSKIGKTNKQTAFE